MNKWRMVDIKRFHSRSSHLISFIIGWMQLTRFAGFGCHSWRGSTRVRSFTFYLVKGEIVEDLENAFNGRRWKQDECLSAIWHYKAPKVICYFRNSFSSERLNKWSQFLEKWSMIWYQHVLMESRMLKPEETHLLSKDFNETNRGKTGEVIVNRVITLEDWDTFWDIYMKIDR